MTVKKRTSLDVIFDDSILTETVAEVEPEQSDKEVSNKTSVKGNRPGVKQQTAYIPKVVYEQLRRLAFEEERKMHDYLMEGLDLVFKGSCGTTPKSVRSEPSHFPEV